MSKSHLTFSSPPSQSLQCLSIYNAFAWLIGGIINITLYNIVDVPTRHIHHIINVFINNVFINVFINHVFINNTINNTINNFKLYRMGIRSE